MLFMKDWYEQYYSAIENSNAYAKLCQRVFGANLGQHGFADMRQLQQLIDAVEIQPDELIVDLGCGIGGILAYVANQTNARAIGLDFVERATQIAKRKYGSSRILFATADIGQNCLRSGCADVIINIDATYFHPMHQIVSEMSRILSSQGRMGLLHTVGPEPEESYEEFDKSKLSPHQTPIAVELHAQGFEYKVTDLTQDDYEHAKLKKKVAEELHDEFVAEANEFLYGNRHDEANGAIRSITDSIQERYLYVATRTGE